MVIMQSLGQASGVPVQFSAPPPPTPAATPAATPVSMKVHFSLVLCMYVGLRAVVDVGVRALWMLAFVPSFLAGFGNLPVQGRCCRNFEQKITYCLFMQEKSTSEGTRRTPIVFVDVAVLPSLRRLATASIRHCPASLTSPTP